MSKIRHWLILVGCFCVFASAFVASCQWVKSLRWCDISVRYHEICCSHTGVNPFDVWSHRVETERFIGWWRPDFPESREYRLRYSGENPEKVRVHAYPPWHTTFAWFYGWMPRHALIAWITVLNTLLFVFFANRLRRWAPIEPASERQEFQLMVFAGIAFQMAYLLGVGNYGGLLLVLIVLMMEAFEKRREVLIGVLWALAMVKPQVGLLLFWPLFFGKCYKAIAVAVTICLLATLWPAYVYHTSPIELLLQVPQIGAPYLVSGGYSPAEVMLEWLGKHGPTLWMGIFFLALGGLSFLVRHEKSTLFRFAPALIVFPFWTYSQLHDHVILALLYVLILREVYGIGKGLLSAGERRWVSYALVANLFSIAIAGSMDFAYRIERLDEAATFALYHSVCFLPTYLPPVLAAWLLIRSVRAARSA